jgi:hypothetical protein
MTPIPEWLRLYAREIVDAAWNEATESAAVPATDWADRIIDRVPAPSDTTRGATTVEITGELEQLRAELEQRTAERDSAREKVEQLFEIAEAAQERAKNAIERAQITMDRILGRTRT